MDNSLQENSPIYMQIMCKIRRSIAAGELAPGERIPPVRELAITFNVNPNTMQRALAELEREGILFTERTAGRFVTADEKTIESLRFQEAKEALAEFKGKMKALGFSEEELLNFLKCDKREKVS